jgi:hypothetical protein
MNKGTRIALLVGAGLVAIQLVPVDRSNPPVEGVVAAPSEVYSILERSCFDCHSNETRWPWYSHVAPVSWLVAHDVHEARGHMNFSEWNRVSVEKQKDHIEDCWKMVAKGKMPLSYYLPMHPDARLSDMDKAQIRGWALASGAEVGEGEEQDE